jgi:chromosome segregation and condensation protein ScpB
LASVAYHQPISRKGLADIFGKQINRDLLHRLRMKELITKAVSQSLRSVHFDLVIDL